eukprot:6192882-Pleurochrysis_carterae.AAC.2
MAYAYIRLAGTTYAHLNRRRLKSTVCGKRVGLYACHLRCVINDRSNHESALYAYLTLLISWVVTMWSEHALAAAGRERIGQAKTPQKPRHRHDLDSSCAPEGSQKCSCFGGRSISSRCRTNQTAHSQHFDELFQRLVLLCRSLLGLHKANIKRNFKWPYRI